MQKYIFISIRMEEVIRKSKNACYFLRFNGKFLQLECYFRLLETKFKMFEYLKMKMSKKTNEKVTVMPLTSDDELISRKIFFS